ncbi:MULTISPECIES: Hsp20/alpha crystallin family protein [unclassified Variovorax]|uniref:Hsp20/alpha crystallin family protein n=1 Tax=unclassified Variovorax TaxID=663243 RepID=UPI0002713E4F|nr:MULTISPECIES: Hsp20/alpha crystallin family protein [unclassified Variovorax]EJL75548.1 molecular chaperone (small heat shock protein) [Variovorax sp. CF313]KQX19900.1 heat-shock protein Hsp20 [Variovorax sp. Root434]
MYRSLFPRDIFAEMDRLQRDVQQAFDLSPSIRGIAWNGFPALNVGSTPQTLEIYAFAPGVDPSTLEVNLERGLLTISGERKSALPEEGDKAAVHINERFEGAFRRVMTLPEDADPDAVNARMSDGVLHITVQRRASAQPRRIAIQ